MIATIPSSNAIKIQKFKRSINENEIQTNTEIRLENQAQRFIHKQRRFTSRHFENKSNADKNKLDAIISNLHNYIRQMGKQLKQIIQFKLICMLVCIWFAV